MINRIRNNITKLRQLHWPEYGAELLGSALVFFGGLSTVVFALGKGLPMEHLIPDKSIRLLITGLLFGGLGPLVAISPLGKLSGAHLNPALSLAFWSQGKMYKYDLGGYIIGQFLGAIIGELLFVFAWRNYAASVRYGVTLPGAGLPLGYVFLAELSMTFVLVLFIFIFLSSYRLMRWTPLMTWLLVAIMIWLEAPISGTSLNPARSIAPALVTWWWKNQWIYCIAPVLGAMLAVVAFRLASSGERDILTCKLFHDPYYRCIFKKVRASHRQG